MYWIVLVAGWVVSIVVITLVWQTGKPGRNLGGGLLVGAVAALLWPVTVWVAVGALLRRSMARDTGGAAESPGVLEAQSRQAEAFAKQAELEGMPSSADYWRAEQQRLDAQRQSAPAEGGPVTTAVIVLGCALASLATVGAVALTAPSTARALPNSQVEGAPVPAAPTVDPVPVTAPPRVIAPPSVAAAPTAVATTQAESLGRGNRVPAALIGEWHGPAVNGGRNYLVEMTVTQGDWGDTIAKVVLDSSWDGRCIYDARLQTSGPGYIEFSMTGIASNKNNCNDDTQTRRIDSATNGTDTVSYLASGEYRGTLERYA